MRQTLSFPVKSLLCNAKGNAVEERLIVNHSKRYESRESEIAQLMKLFRENIREVDKFIAVVVWLAFDVARPWTRRESETETHRCRKNCIESVTVILSCKQWSIHPTPNCRYWSVRLNANLHSHYTRRCSISSPTNCSWGWAPCVSDTSW